ncbi:MAG: diguanylate cyclase [Deltaproteobacteria bacterium]|nr:diguanylate cyclase [Deltaproteobacteria bacterium]
MPHREHLHIDVRTNRPELARAMETTLNHVYPGVSLEVITKDAALPTRHADLFVIDTVSCNGKLESLLEAMPETPLLMVVPTLAEARPFRKHVQGRRDLVTESDLAGMALIHVVHHLLDRQKMHEQIQKTSHKLKEMAIRDELTKLFNHKHFNDLLVQEVKKANRYKRPLAIVIMAIKNMTTMNKVLGHAEGDRLLTKTAAFIHHTVREVDVAARYGDNEFSVILPESDETAARRAAERMQKAFEPLALPLEQGGFGMVASFGVAALSETITSKEDLLKYALGALLEAKKANASMVCSSTDTSDRHKTLAENRALIDRLHDRIVGIGNEAERAYFQALMKTVGEVPLMKNLLIPHAERVAFFSERLALKVGFTNGHAHTVRRSGLLHDIGKLAIDTEILTKKDPLNATELDLLRQHPVFAVEMLGESPFLSEEMEAIRHHHERFDGSGYPDGLTGEAIPRTARIIAIAEAWDTMVSPQPYRREPLSLDTALKELQRGAGHQFDPDLVTAFSSLIAG